MLMYVLVLPLSPNTTLLPRIGRSRAGSDVTSFTNFVFAMPTWQQLLNHSC